MNEECNKAVKTYISESLDNLASLLINLDADGSSYFIDFNDEDALNIIIAFNSIMSNKAIKNGVITTEDAAKNQGDRFRKFLLDSYNIDSIELSNKVINERKKNN